MSTVTVFIYIGLFFFCLTSLAIIDVATKDFGSLKAKVIWGCVAFIPFIGWLIYLVFGFRKGKRKQSA